MSNKAELLKKIKALADRGVDGERESAQTLLARLMEQYGISETEIEEERRETAWFPYSQETERRLLNQIIYMVTGAGVLLFRWGQGYALAERGYEAIGGEALLLGLPLFWYLTETTIRDTVRDFRKGGRHK